ncbi:MAG: hypothetical protein K1X94_37040 [Sandaracinaceae bacterium]|nr:hypothetical protein [Sandaracinaceae bacterium]
MRSAWLGAVLVASLLSTSEVRAAGIVADRAVARFSDPEAADATAAQKFVMMRELVLEAWLVAYERTPAGSPSIDDKSLRIALDRHVIEAVLGARPLPSAWEAKVGKETADVERAEVLALGGKSRFGELLVRATGNAEGGAAELAAIWKRRARAELYLEAAVGLTYEPSEGELHAVHAKLLGSAPFEPTLVRAYARTMKLREGAQAYHQAVRSKLRLEIVSET